MTLGEEIAQSRSKIRQLKAELEAEEATLRGLENGCKHKNETIATVRLIEGCDLAYPMAQCNDCGCRSFISKKHPSRRNYPNAALP